MTLNARSATSIVWVTELPSVIADAKRLILYSMRLLKLHGRMRVEEKATHNTRVYTLSVEIPVEDQSTSLRELKRFGSRQRG